MKIASNYVFPVLLMLLIYAVGIINQWYYGLSLLILFLPFNKIKPLLKLGYNSFLIALLFLDLFLRVFPIIPLYFRPFEMLNQPHSMVKYLYHLRPNSTIEMDQIGDLGAMLGDQKFQIKKHTQFITDELGFRNYPKQAEKENKVTLLGDSYTMGSGVDQDSTISSLIPSESYSLGFPGGIGDATIRYTVFSDQIKRSEHHQTYLLFFEGNDYSNGWINQLEYDSLSLFSSLTLRYSSFRKRSPIKQLYTRIFYYDYDEHKKERVKIEGDELIYKDHLSEINKTDFNYSLALQNFQLLKELCKKNESELIVIFIPSKESYHSSDAKTDSLSKLMQTAGINFHRINNDFKKSGFNRAQIWQKDDTHLSAKGNKIIAGYIQSRVDVLTDNK